MTDESMFESLRIRMFLALYASLSLREYEFLYVGVIGAKAQPLNFATILKATASAISIPSTAAERMPPA